MVISHRLLFKSRSLKVNTEPKVFLEILISI